MFRLMTDIGCAAGIVPFHATRLTIDGDDSAGAGSADLDEERDEQDRNIVDDESLEDEGLDDDQPRGRRTARQEEAYDKIKSDRDRLKTEAERREQENRELQARLAKLEQGQETRESVNARTNASLELAQKRADEIVAEIEKLDRNDPQYSRKVYTALLTRVQEDQVRAAEQISRQTSTEVYRETRTREQIAADAERQTVAELERVGLSKENLRLVRMVAKDKMETEGEDWFRRTPNEQQIPKLVEEVAAMIKGPRRNSQEARDDRRRHREPMDGVLGEGSRGNRGGTRSGEDDGGTQEGPGSILADLARMRRSLKRNTGLMLRQNER